MSRTSVRFVAVACLVLCTLLAGCKTDQAAKSEACMGMINDTCPVTKQPVDPNSPSVVYNGSRIGFCCAGCIAGWNRMSEEQKKAYVRAHAR